MKEEEILDAPNRPQPTASKLPMAALCIFIIFLGLLIDNFMFNQLLNAITQYFLLVGVLYFFYKKTNLVEYGIGDRFLWCTLIIFSGYMMLSIFFLVTIDSGPFNLTFFLFSGLGNLFRSVILANFLSIGIYHLIKNRNWAMLVLMVFVCWFCLTTLAVNFF